MKRFYRQVSVIEQEGGFAITLDDKRLKSPAQRELELPTHALAMAIRREWAEQGDAIQPRSMPMMQLASTLTDRVKPQRDAVVEALLRYGGSDLLCYRADRPETLVMRQDAVWQPLIDWIAVEHSAELTVTRGMMPVSQPKAALDALAACVAAHADAHLTAMLVAAAASSSLCCQRS
jgi:chaperone required for assembly of F1-ATPase